MKHSPELMVALEFAYESLKANEKGELVLAVRKRIWRAMGPRRKKGVTTVVEPGIRRRARLALLASQYVVPIWEQAFPGNQGPARILAVAEEYLARRVDFTVAWNSFSRFWAELEDLHSSGVAAGYAAAQALLTALNDERFDLEGSEKELSDHDLDPYLWDAGFYASVAYARSAPWEPELNMERRREFWEWYLNEAIPKAWDTVVFDALES